MVARLPGEPKPTDGFVKDCPKDCPFLATYANMRACQFSLFANKLEPGRYTRMTIEPDGSYNWHIPPNCDVYKKYRGHKVKIEADNGYLALNDEHLTVTAPKHERPAKHHGDYYGTKYNKK